MTSTPADQIITVLRSEHDWLVAFLEAMDPADVNKMSAASEWTIAQVLSHLGSGAEITLAGLEAALSGTDARGPDFNQSVWDRWNAMGAEQQARDFITANENLVARYESIDAPTRASLRIDLGFLPEPIDLATAAGLRLNEFAHHSWDVRVVFDPAATMSIAAATHLIDRFALLFGWLGRADALPGPVGVLAVRTFEPEREFGVELGEKVALVDVPAQPAAVLSLPAESWLRLIVGRLAPANTPGTVELSAGPVGLEDLRRVFPGF